jgi:hypothetical protein
MIPLVACVLLLGGCDGRPEVPVHGTVTLDGAPLASALVVFHPRDGKVDPAFATTDAAGTYEAYGGSGRSAVPVGTYKVSISTLRRDDDNPSRNAPERVPAKYNTETTLVVDVGLDASDKRFDFAIDGRP